MESFERVACFGGIYSNYLALEAAVSDAKRRGVDKIFCLGDMGAFGPHPDRVFPILETNQVFCLQGNYDDSIGNALNDCQCGYTDPRDNHYAQLSYDYTLNNTCEEARKWLRALPKQHRFLLGEKSVLLCHGSPRRVNEFLWASTTSDSCLEKLFNDYQAEVLVASHTGIKWQASVGDKRFVNCGALGRPENDGLTNVWYSILSSSSDARESIGVEFVPVAYDYRKIAAEMVAEKLPDEFVETIMTGWWTTCLEVLPGKERVAGKF